jgi:hypothetical protein
MCKTKREFNNGEFLFLVFFFVVVALGSASSPSLWVASIAFFDLTICTVFNCCMCIRPFVKCCVPVFFFFWCVCVCVCSHHHQSHGFCRRGETRKGAKKVAKESPAALTSLFSLILAHVSPRVSVWSGLV